MDTEELVVVNICGFEDARRDYYIGVEAVSRKEVEKVKNVKAEGKFL